MRERIALRIEQDSYENWNTSCGRDLYHLLGGISLATGFSLRRDVGYLPIFTHFISLGFTSTINSTNAIGLINSINCTYY